MTQPGGELDQQKSKIEAECQNKRECEDEYQALKMYYQSMPTNLPMINPDPYAQNTQPKNPHANAMAVHKKKEQIREAEFEQILPSNVKFMAHSLAGHGGTVSDQMLGLLNKKSRFYSNKWLFHYAMKVYEYRWANPGRAQYGAFPGIPSPTGTQNIGKTGGTPSFQTVDEVGYQFLPGKSCQLSTVYPAPNKP